MNSVTGMGWMRITNRTNVTQKMARERFGVFYRFDIYPSRVPSVDVRSDLQFFFLFFKSISGIVNITKNSPFSELINSCHLVYLTTCSNLVVKTEVKFTAFNHRAF